MRIDSIDILRGGAIVGMIVFHANYLLEHVFDNGFHFISDSIWGYVGFSTAVLFIFLSGYIQSYTARDKSFRRNLTRALKRAVMLGILAGIVTLVTYSFIPDQRISWGILHFFALSTLLQVFCYRLGIFVLPLIVLIFIISSQITSLRVDYDYLVPLGILPYGYYSADYYPILPWFGYMLLGQGIEYIFRGTELESRFSHLKFPKLQFFAFLGRNSLILYILHVPILYLLFFLFLK